MREQKIELFLKLPFILNSLESCCGHTPHPRVGGVDTSCPEHTPIVLSIDVLRQIHPVLGMSVLAVLHSAGTIESVLYSTVGSVLHSPIQNSSVAHGEIKRVILYKLLVESFVKNI